MFESSMGLKIKRTKGNARALRLIVFCCVIAFPFSDVICGERPKVGVVLSGGGAKGFAHIGALRVLEEAGIPIDYIAGTSMGSIVGGLYAIGYDSQMIDSLVREQDWGYLLSDEIRRKHLPANRKETPDVFVLSLPYQIKIKERKGQVSLPPGVVRGQNLYNLFLNLTIGYQHETDFGQLPIPFACVSADSRSGREIVFRNGILPEAIRSSMAIPGLFAPVEKDSMLLIDGGIVNNYPVDVVREMGADIVIGIIMPRDPREDEKRRGSLTEVINQLWNFIGQEKLSKNIAHTDILITPDVHPYGMLDFVAPAIDTIISRGEQAARIKWDELTALKKELQLSDSDNPALRIQRKNPYLKMDTLQIRSVRFEGLSKIDETEMIRKINIADNKITRQELSAITSRIYAMGLFNRVYYRLDGEMPFDLVFTVEEKNLNTLDVGIRFDTGDMASILTHTSLRFNSSLNSVIDLTTRLSKNPYLKINYSINRKLFYKGGISVGISRNNMDINENGKFSYKADFIRSNLQLNFSEFYLYNLRLQIGANADILHYLTKPLPPTATRGIHTQNDLYINYFVNGVYDNLNKSYMPDAGQFFSATYQIHTDNFYRLYGELPLQSFSFRFFKPIRLGEAICFTPEISARTLVSKSDSIPFLYANFAGGQYDGHYLPQQIALRGSHGMENMQKTIGALKANLSYQFTAKQQIFLNLHGLAQHDKLQNLPNGEYFFGGSVGYTNQTLLGPLTVEMGYSSLSHRMHLFASIGYYF